MTRTIVPLILSAFLLAPLAMADAPREPFPSDYTPLPCARPDLIGKSVERPGLAAFAQGIQRVNLRQKWVNEHWDEMTAAFEPLQKKIASCLAVPGNEWTFCNDFMFDAFLATANRYEAGSDDDEQWRMATKAYSTLIDPSLRAAHKAAQDCAAQQPATAERTLEAWTRPEKIDPDSNAMLIVYAVDAETHVPVMASIGVEGQKLPYSRDSPDGLPRPYYPFKWPLKYDELRDAAGHRDLVPPTLVITAKGYQTLRMSMPIDPPQLIVEMNPPAAQLKPGKNEVTITTRDAATGKPVEMRVMVGTRGIGNSNEPLTLTLPASQPRPEIWLTSLFNRYGDVVLSEP